MASLPKFIQHCHGTDRAARIASLIDEFLATSRRRSLEDSLELREMENAAYGSEPMWWDFYNGW
jgi:hypothetical protein